MLLGFTSCFALKQHLLRAHILLCILAYVEHHMGAGLAPIFMTSSISVAQRRSQDFPLRPGPVTSFLFLGCRLQSFKVDDQV